MAKIDVASVENYANMTAEEKVAFFEAYEIPEVKPTNDGGEVEKLKTALSKANSEAANWKKQYRDKLTEQEKAEADRAERDKAKDEELETLRREKAIAGYKATYLGLGYDAELADKTAEAMANGDYDTVFANQKAFLDAQKKAIEAAALGKQPELTAGTPPKPENIEDKSVAAFRKAAMGW